VLAYIAVTAGTIDVMADAPETLACAVHSVAGGVLVVPTILPFYVPDTALTLTVEEWLGIRAA
jgi:hypothetical protein